MKQLVLIVFILFAATTACTEQTETEAAFIKAEAALPIVNDEVYDAPENDEPTAIEEPASQPELELAPEPDPEPIFPNEVGEIMILVYHGLHEETPGPYDRLTSDFRNDLQMLYDQGYRLISMADLINNNITTPAGYTPVVLSFDDSLPSAFSLKELEDGTLTPVPDTAVYIINAFYEKNPSFGRTAIFFVNAWREPFEGEGTLEARFRYLIDNGFEVGNHSYNHPDFSRLNAQRLQQEMGSLNQFIRRHLPDYQSLAMAYPFSIRPHAGLRHYALAGEYNGIPYNYTWALRVGNTGSPAVPHHVRFDPLNVSRVIASDASTNYRSVPDLGYLLRRFEREPHLRFISDGNPNTITVPRCQLHYVDMYSLGDKELVVYDRHEADETYGEDEETSTDMAG
ncbi:MAG: polysaccharide deacetylase family protein [Defluviitaleaceae bacterium]|nr:polysaccharide deacetylase family protein [Defluviitaleaceae bacterium]